MGMALLWGCAGTGEMVSLNVQPQQPFVQSGRPEPLKIVIEPFEDLRADTSKIGQRTHLGGGVTNFNVSGGKPGVTIAEALAEALRQRGWNRRGWDARVVRQAESDRDVVELVPVDALGEPVARRGNDVLCKYSPLGSDNW